LRLRHPPAGNLPIRGGVQAVVRRHFVWLQTFWTPTSESYTAHGPLIVDSDLHKAYEAYHAQLSQFIAAGICIFAEKELA